MAGITTPTPRVWIATFVGMVFTIGVLTGIVAERTWLHPAFRGMPGGQMRPGGPDGPGGLGGGPGSPGRGGGRLGGGGSGRGSGRGGPMFGPPPQQYVADLATEVHLTDSQRADVLALLEAQETRLVAMQEDARKVFIAEQEALHDKIAALLSPDQATMFREWVTKRTGLRGRGPSR